MRTLDGVMGCAELAFDQYLRGGRDEDGWRSSRGGEVPVTLGGRKAMAWWLVDGGSLAPEVRVRSGDGLCSARLAPLGGGEYEWRGWSADGFITGAVDEECASRGTVRLPLGGKNG